MPQQAEIIDFKTGRPIGEMVSNAESMVLLSLLASRAMEAGADPSAIVSPDHKLLMLCDEIIMKHRQADKMLNEWIVQPGEAQSAKYDAEKRERRSLLGPLVMLGRLRPATPVGVFAKAVVVHHVGHGAAKLAISLARDLLECPGLREAIWPAAQEPPP